MKIERITEIDNDVVEAFKRLVPQLTGNTDYPSSDDLNNIVSAETTYLYVAKDDDGKIVGSLTIVLYRIPTGLKGIIEDVMVDESARGKGIATMLMNKAIDTARNNNAYKIELTSNPARVAANNMYRNMGFVVRDTNFYRLDL